MLSDPSLIFAMSLSRPWGFDPRTRYSGDQVPLPFVCGLGMTYEDVGAQSVEISQPSDGLEKRQATIHLAFRPVKMKPVAVADEGHSPWPFCSIQQSRTSFAMVFFRRGMVVSNVLFFSPSRACCAQFSYAVLL